MTRGTKCPKCKNNMRYSNLTQDGFVCKHCNQVYIQEGDKFYKLKGGM